MQNIGLQPAFKDLSSGYIKVPGDW